MIEEGAIVEECPVCEQGDPDCVWCDGEGFIPHECEEL